MDELRTLMRDALKLKGKFHATTCQAHELELNIRTDPKWDWAVGKIQGEKKLEQASNKLKHAVTDWQREFVITDIAEIKRKYNKSRLIIELGNFVKQGGLVQELERVCKSLLKMTNEMQDGA